MLRDKVRTMLKIRVERRTPPISVKPLPGRFISRGPHRMVVTVPLPDDLWSYLTLLGWREIAVVRDRRRYADLPPASLEVLMRTPPTQRDACLRQLLGLASAAGQPSRPFLGRVVQR